MPRSHPPTLLTLAERTLREECALRRGETLLVALSGGGDSTALVHVLSRLAPRLGFGLVAHGVDHGLRAEAAAELDLAAALCDRLEVPFGRTRVDVRPGGNLQARAREARQGALLAAAAARGATRIATAHHADDRAETVLIRLLHGARPQGLDVLGPAEGRFIRPLLRARKRDVLAHLGRHGLPYAEDPSNLNPRFLRVRVRLEVLPLLEALSPQIVSHLNALSDELGQGPLPEVEDELGVPLRLSRAQRLAVQRAVDLGRSAQLRISGARDVVVAPKVSEVRGDRAGPGKMGPPTRTREGARTSVVERDAPRIPGQKGGAKTSKSG